jgi:peptidoglycan hydrolase-like protein with peptidoglycan-binding domain
MGVSTKRDLTAARFAGDPTFEAVYDGRQLLKNGNKGPAVEELQQALEDLGFSLPRFGADGMFGSETKSAVEAFQRGAGLTGRQVDGIVGPTTMRLLDEHVAFDHQIRGVPVVGQPSNKTCWATVATMLLSWRDSTSYEIREAMDRIDSKWGTKFGANQGLFAAEKEPFLSDAGLVAEPPQNYSVEGLYDLLVAHGPLWLTTDEDTGSGFSIHARILTGMSGDGSIENTTLTLIDPAGGGRVVRESFRTFTEKFEEEAVDVGVFRVQVVHWP